jgi:transposase
MSLHPEKIGEIPEETARIAKACFPKGNRYIRLRETLGTIFDDHEFADLFPRRGQPAEAPWRLALVCLVQYMEELTDRQAADTVRSRMDIKYLLGLELTDPGFDFSVLSEFRTRLVEHQAEHRLFELLVTRLGEQGYLKKRGSQRTDSTHILAAVHRYHRVELLPETLRAALNEVAVQAPEWLQSWVPVDWFKRYGRRIEEARLSIKKEEHEAFLEQVGRDGSQLLSRLYQEEAPALLFHLPQVQILRQIWVQHFFWEDGQFRLRNKDTLPPSHLTLRSPYDPEAHIGKKGGFAWYGYKVHLSETCDAEYPHLITCVQTTDATASDMNQTQVIHEELERRDVLPQTHLVDAGYVDAGLLVESHERYEVELLGPVSRNNQWQAKAGKGYDLSGFEVDFEAKEATCPQGQKSIDWKDMRDQHGHPKLYIRFDEQTCRQCPCRSLCTRAEVKPRRLSIRSQEEFLQLQRRREQQETEAFQVTYAKRAGIEGTHSQAVRTLGLRQCRYIGLQKASLQHSFIAAALNLLRLDNFLTGEKMEQTRISHFAALAPKKAA